MIQSMTGFGKATAEIASKKLSVEIKSLNSKQLDLAVKLPVAYKEREIEMRKQIAAELERGKVDVVISMESRLSGEMPRLNLAVVREYYTQIQQMFADLGMAADREVLLPTLLRMPNVMTQDETPEVDAAELDAVQQLLTDALRALVVFRQQEGRMLQQVFEEKITNIRSLLSQVEQYEAERITAVRQRLLDQLATLPVNYDNNRFEQELIYYIEKLDINEEKRRLDNHLNYFVETMNDNEKGTGKKLGFIAQEMGREINTLGSKANHAELQRIVVRMKDELEQIKEQVLNVL